MFVSSRDLSIGLPQRIALARLHRGLAHLVHQDGIVGEETNDCPGIWRPVSRGCFLVELAAQTFRQPVSLLTGKGADRLQDVFNPTSHREIVPSREPKSAAERGRPRTHAL